MAKIDTYLANILKAVYGEEVRGSIHDAIDEINKEVITATNTSNTAKTAATDASNSAAASASAASASETAAQAAQTAAEAAEARNEANVTAAEQAARDAQSRAESARDTAITQAGNAQASAASAKTSRDEAERYAKEAQQAAYGDLYATAIPMTEEDQTYKISDAINDVNEKVDNSYVLFSFTGLTFTASGTKYVSLVEDTRVTAKHKPGDLRLQNRDAQVGDLEISTSDGYLTFTMEGEPPVAFSGELDLHLMP